ncbi:MAG: oligosaccharide flippase family protein [Acidilobaceae archaeon]
MRLSEVFVKAGVSITIANYASIAIAALGSIAVARLLGPEGYGLAAVSLLIPTVMTALAGFSLSGVLSSVVASETSYSSRRRFYSSALILVLATSSALAFSQIVASSWLASLLGRRELAGYLIVLAPYVVGVSTLTVSQAALNGLGLFHLSAALTLLSTALRVALSITLVLLGYGVLGFLLGQSLTFLSMGLASVLIAYRVVGGVEAPALSAQAMLLARSLPLHASSIASMIIDSVKTGFLYRVALDLEVGNLALASRLATPIQQITSALQTAALVASSRGENSRALEGFRLAVERSSLVLVAVAGFLVLSIDLIVEILFGGRFELAPSYFYFIIAPFLLSPLGYQLAGSFLVARGRVLEYSRISATLSLASLPLAIVLTSVAGVYGFLVAQLAMAVFSALVYAIAIWGRGVVQILYEGARTISPLLSGIVVGLAFKIILPGAFGTLLGLIAYTTIIAIALPLVVSSSELSQLGAMLEKLGPPGSLVATVIIAYARLADVLWSSEPEEETGR